MIFIFRGHSSWSLCKPLSTCLGRLLLEAKTPQAIAEMDTIPVASSAGVGWAGAVSLEILKSTRWFGSKATDDTIAAMTDKEVPIYIQHIVNFTYYIPYYTCVIGTLFQLRILIKLSFFVLVRPANRLRRRSRLCPQVHPVNHVLHRR